MKFNCERSILSSAFSTSSLFSLVVWLLNLGVDFEQKSYGNPIVREKDRTLAYLICHHHWYPLKVWLMSLIVMLNMSHRLGEGCSLIRHPDVRENQ